MRRVPPAPRSSHLSTLSASTKESISPRSLLYDVPVEYSGYRPVNYDETYHGAVTVEDALIRSLNVPAVNLSAKLGSDGVYTLLKRRRRNDLTQAAGILWSVADSRWLRSQSPRIDQSLLRLGQWWRLPRLSSAQNNSGTSIQSDCFLTAACYIVTDILTQLRRPELPAVWEATLRLPKVAWKTGTSYGKRDAWSIGYTPRYTVGVWVGNFDGKGHPASRRRRSRHANSCSPFSMRSKAPATVVGSCSRTPWRDDRSVPSVACRYRQTALPPPTKSTFPACHRISNAQCTK